MSTAREIAVVLPPPGKGPSAGDIADVLATCERIGVKVRLVAHDAPEVLMSVASEHADPTAFRHSVAIDNLMREMAIHPHEFGKTADVVDTLDVLPFSPWPDAPLVTSQGLPRAASQKKRRRRARRGGGR